MYSTKCTAQNVQQKMNRIIFLKKLIKLFFFASKVIQYASMTKERLCLIVLAVGYTLHLFASPRKYAISIVFLHSHFISNLSSNSNFSTSMAVPFSNASLSCSNFTKRTLPQEFNISHCCVSFSGEHSGGGAGSYILQWLQAYITAGITGAGYVPDSAVRPSKQDIADHQSDPYAFMRWNKVFYLPARPPQGACKSPPRFIRSKADVSLGWNAKWDTIYNISRQSCPSLSNDLRNHTIVSFGSNVASEFGNGFLWLHAPLFREVFPWLKHGDGRYSPNIAIHIRRGDISRVTDYDFRRSLPNIHYIRIVNAILDVLVRPGHILPTINFYTDAIMPGQPPFNITEFNAIRIPYEFHVGGDEVKVLQELATSDVLVTSKSSFSIAAAVLHDQGFGLIIATDFADKYRVSNTHQLPAMCVRGSTHAYNASCRLSLGDVEVELTNLRRRVSCSIADIYRKTRITA